MDEPISETPKNNRSEDKILTRIAILLCVLLIAILAGGIYASKNIRPAKIESGSNKVELSQSVVRSNTAQSDAVQPGIPQPGIPQPGIPQSDMLRVSKVVDGDTIVVEDAQ